LWGHHVQKLVKPCEVVDIVDVVDQGDICIGETSALLPSIPSVRP
jgi:hypothetical protein